jgi:hypothetical protein
LLPTEVDVVPPPPPPELVPTDPPPLTVELAFAEQEEPAVGEVDFKRKLKELKPGTEANSTGEDPKCLHVDGETDDRVRIDLNDTHVLLLPSSLPPVPRLDLAAMAMGLGETKIVCMLGPTSRSVEMISR